MPAGQSVTFEVEELEALPADYDSTATEYRWRTQTWAQAEPSIGDFDGYTTSLPFRSIRLTDPGWHKVYCMVVYKKDASSPSRDQMISGVLTIPVRAWDRPTVSATPPADLIEAGDVSLYDGKYVGVTGHPDRARSGGHLRAHPIGDAGHK